MLDIHLIGQNAPESRGLSSQILHYRPITYMPTWFVVQTLLAKTNVTYRRFILPNRPQEAIADLEFALPLLASKRAVHKALAGAYRSLGLRDLVADHERLAKET
jgi:hypothetical protein